MAYNLVLAQRIHTLLEGREGLTEKKMFSGVGFMLNGNMACGVHGEDLIVRVGPEKYDMALSRPHVRPFPAPGGKPMAGWILVAAEGWEQETDLQNWVSQGTEYALSLPGKK
jgi:TfoX/Sxy family transcriptional regulator of competence genes